MFVETRNVSLEVLFFFHKFETNSPVVKKSPEQNL